ncbi:acyl-CoA N-acyltransferase [Cercophora newfieldiana]|uniref:Acyl-CoA N-acyltransferase n=1 Tax=Cercophora newfieldiana TaxID=92897 RepID=A0AA39Y6N9_9PEZI|nr:acyl-CoA N-acyltransferase [Cercophora newfieldiana]
MSVRAAVPADAHTITEIAIAALPSDEQWPYRFRYAQQYPKDHWSFSYRRFLSWIQAAPHFTVLVVEIPQSDTTRVIGYSVWQMPGTFVGDSIVHLPRDQYGRRDGDPARMKAFRDALSAARQRLFDGPYGNDQLNLVQIAVDPSYQRRGAGMLMTNWGLDKSHELSVTVTLFASAQGRRLYRKLGFNEVDVVHVQADGEDVFVDIPAMTYRAGVGTCPAPK